MKTSVWGKSILALVFTFMCSLAISAASPKDYLYDTKEENGKIISKVVFLQENGLLNKQVRYEFQYNENGKVSEKKSVSLGPDKRRMGSILSDHLSI